MDKDEIKKILTYKSGQFIFSRNYSVTEIIELSVKSSVLYQTVIDLPILPSLAACLEEEAIRKSIFGTAAIEGNPLTEEQVEKILSEPKDTRSFKQAEKEIQNLKNVYAKIKYLPAKVSDQGFLLTEDFIKEIHKDITKDIEHPNNIPGQYRNHIVKVGDIDHGGIYTPPKILDDIKPLMGEFILWINSDELKGLDPRIRAALAHYHLGLIHPFGDGNGRTARAIEAIILSARGIKYVPVMLSNFYYKNIDQYFRSFSESENNENHDVTPFIKFVLAGFVDSLEEMKKRIIYFIRKFALRDYYTFLRDEKNLSQRQYDLLMTLLENNIPFSFEDLFIKAPINLLYRKVSKRTAQRDLSKLVGKEFLKINNDKYSLNLRVME